jgi:hypothetical protein
LFGDSEGEEEREEVTDPEPDEMSKDAKEKEWVISHKEMKSAELYLATARDNLTTALYSQKTYPGAETDAQLAERRKELRATMTRVVSARAKDAMLTISVIAHRREAVEKAAAEQQDKEEGREKLADAAQRKGAEKAPAPAEPWGRPRTMCDTCCDAKATCVWCNGNTKRIWACKRCWSWKASCKIGGALDPQSQVLKPKLVHQGDGASEDCTAKRWQTDAEAEVGGSGVGSSRAMTGVGARGIATGVGGGGGSTGAGTTKEPSASTTVGQLIRLVAAQSEHMAWLGAQMERMVNGLERQMGQITDQVERVRNQVGRVVGVMERAEGWTVARGGGRVLGVERPRNGSEQRGLDRLLGLTIVVD